MRNSDRGQIKVCNAQIHIMPFFKSTEVWRMAPVIEPTQYYLACVSLGISFL